MTINIKKTCLLSLFSTLIFTSFTGCGDNTGITGPTGANGPTGSSTNTGTSGKTFFSVYMVGSDLEDDISPRNDEPDEKESGQQSLKGAGTSDLKEILAGYESLSDNEKNNIDIMVAFGGARKAGWQGVKYADLSCLKKDSEDGYFGNDTCYSFSDKSTNMGEEKSLQKFFETAKTKSAGSGKKISVLWNHGNAYNGVGLDSNHQDLLFLPEINRAFENSGLKLDLIGFDACLMASLEVAKTVNNYASYMVASEELEPGHGWNYTEIINFIGKNAGAGIPETGKKIVDIFLDSEKHKKSKNKTLSLLNLKETGNLIKNLDSFVAASDDSSFPLTLNSLNASQQFGVNPKENLVTSIDLKSFAKNIQKNNSRMSAQASQLIGSIDQFVVYSRNDTSILDSNGVSVFSLNKDLKKSYSADISVSKDFLDFTDRFINFGTNDTSSPVISSAGMAIKADDEDQCTFKGKEGHCLKISDNKGLDYVEQVFGVVQEDGKILMLGTKELETTDNNGTYFFEAWDGYWLVLCDGGCTEDNNALTSAYFEELTENGNAIFTSDADIYYDDPEDGFEAVIYYEVKLDSNGDPEEVIAEWVVPYEEDKNGNFILSKEQYNFEDLLADGPFTIQFYYLITDETLETEEWEPGDEIQITNSPGWDVAELTDELIYFVAAGDYNGNISFSDNYFLDAIEEE